MPAPVYIGDEISAAGWRLAGATVAVPARGSETATLSQACAGADLVLVSAAVAERIDAATLAAAALALAPLVLVVPDPQGAVAPADLAGRLRAQLGLEA
jgi:vacuolar-type H+-ATPase subunit F/Vma7